MIGKVSMGHGAAGVISYCYYGENGKVDQNGNQEIRGELLYSNEVFEQRLPNGHLHIKQLAAQFHQTAALNEKTRKFIWHQSFSFPPEETVNDETMVKIAQDFAKEFGFDSNQYLVFRHRDTPHEHFHIIANRIDESGTNTASEQHNYERIQQFCRKMEQKYNLQPVENHHQKLDNRHNRTNGQLDRIRKAVDWCLSRCQTLSELSIALKEKGIVTHLGRGISFTDQRTGVSCKGSDLGREYSRQSIEQGLGKDSRRGRTSSRKANEREFDGHKRQAIREIIDRACGQTQLWQRQAPKEARSASLTASWKDFEKHLQAEGVKVRMIKRNAGEATTKAPVGIVFQIGNRYVSGQELGEYYTSKALSLRFGRSQEEFERLYRVPSPTPTPGPQPEKGSKEAEPNAGQLKPSFQLDLDSVRLIDGPDAAKETEKDLAKIADALRKQSPQKQSSKRRRYRR